MAKGFNQCCFIGNLGDEPTIKITQSGTQVANFSLAVNESRKTPDGSITEFTEWVRIVAWGKLAEIVQKYLHKGSQVHVTGKFRTREYTDKHNIKRYITEINCDDIVMLGGNPNAKAQGQNNAHNQGNYQQNAGYAPQPQQQPYNGNSYNASAPSYPQNAQNNGYASAPQGQPYNGNPQYNGQQNTGYPQPPMGDLTDNDLPF